MSKSSLLSRSHIWGVIRALDYLPKVTVVYFWEGVRRNSRVTPTSRDQRHATVNGGVRRNTSHVTPTPEEEYVVATQVAWHQRRGGVRRNTSHVTPTPEEEYVVATQVAWHQRRGGGVCRRNTSRVTPTPEEEYVATQVTWHQHRRRSMSSQHKSCDTNAEEEEYVATQVVWHLCRRSVATVALTPISYPHVFFSPKCSYFLYQSFNFLLLLSCVVMTLNISLIQIVYCIQSCMSLMSSLLFTKIIIKKMLSLGD